MTTEQIAQVAHEVNKAYCESIGDHSQRTWHDAEQWERDSALRGVKYALDNPNASPGDQHEEWKAAKVADGWTYGPTKDPLLRLHPCIVPYEDLPREQRSKDYLFRQVVHSL